jgi:predicted nuclease with TOPRIM domain
MEQSRELVSKIHNKVLDLLSQHHELQDKCVNLQTENTELEDLLASKNKEIEELKEQIVKLKITRSLTDNKSSTEVNTKIDELLREVDKCLGLLNQ